MTERSVAHGTFVVTRTYPAKPDRVFRAWADPAIKHRWFGGGTMISEMFEFREGGREVAKGEAGGASFVFDVLYQDIVQDNRIIYAYQMTMNGTRISASVASIELFAEGDGTRMTVTEHGCFLDGLDSVDQRRDGTEQLVDALGAELARQAAN